MGAEGDKKINWDYKIEELYEKDIICYSNGKRSKKYC